MSLEREQLHPTGDIGDIINALVDDYRDTCLWFLRSDFYPTTFEQRLRVLKYIERYGDRTAFLKAADARRWLLQSTNEKSAAS